MIVFDHPAALSLCAAPLAWALLHGLSRRRGRRGFSLPLDHWGGRPVPDAPAGSRILLSAGAWAVAAAWLLLSVAAAGPSSVHRTGLPGRAELDLVFVVDVSPSMASMDLRPDRLSAARDFIRRYLADGGDGASGASVGIVAFGGSAALACPPTTDYATLAGRLEALAPGMYGDGTAIGQGLALAFRHLSTGSGSRKVAVLLTDGEDNVGLVDPTAAASAFARAGAGLVVLGLGTRGDVPFRYTDPATGEVLSGSYRSEYDESALSALARAAGGAFLPTPDEEALARALPALGRAGGQLSVRPSGSLSLRRPVGRELVLLALALAGFGWAVRRLWFGGVA